jgi:hypothetical protein
MPCDWYIILKLLIFYDLMDKLGYSGWAEILLSVLAGYEDKGFVDSPLSVPMEKNSLKN